MVLIKISTRAEEESKLRYLTQGLGKIQGQLPTVQEFADEANNKREKYLILKSIVYPDGDDTEINTRRVKKLLTPGSIQHQTKKLKKAQPTESASAASQSSSGAGIGSLSAAVSTTNDLEQARKDAQAVPTNTSRKIVRDPVPTRTIKWKQENGTWVKGIEQDGTWTKVENTVQQPAAAAASEL